MAVQLFQQYVKNTKWLKRMDFRRNFSVHLVTHKPLRVSGNNQARPNLIRCSCDAFFKQFGHLMEKELLFISKSIESSKNFVFF